MSSKEYIKFLNYARIMMRNRQIGMLITLDCNPKNDNNWFSVFQDSIKKTS